ncbi:MAG: 16S rRNA (uracil(1498)-N(3))-methyltransferase [SAR202 cluster bacterium]|nr:16S rRNA (uracil(1498)-N(3))-methyltransferase [SAR202 cluster bacterium]
MPRFLVDASAVQGERALLTGEVAHRISRVLRMSPGATADLLDGAGNVYSIVISSIDRDRVSCRVTSTTKDVGEPSVRITLCQGIMKSDKFDWVLQKGTEVGISEFVPMVSKRSVPKRSDAESPGKRARWAKIIAEAMEQSGRSRLPVLHPATTFDDACALATPNSLALIPWEEARGRGLKQVLTTPIPHRVLLYIGPEGGFDSSEVQHAQSLGIHPVSLGSRILRAETAGLVAASAILYHTSDLGG